MHHLMIALAAFVQLNTAGPGSASNAPDVERALAAVRAEAAERRRHRAVLARRVPLLRPRDTAGGGRLDSQGGGAASIAPAEFQLGQLYDFGFGVAQSDRDALTWYRKAAEHGSVPAQRAVGDFYQKGRGGGRRRCRGRALVPARRRRGRYPRAISARSDVFRRHRRDARLRVRVLWFSLAAGQTPLEDNRKGLLELRNIAAARMTPAAAAGRAAGRRVEADRV